ncbi:MAG: nickel pincer cofactor biosynthesis protein LarC [Gemmatimonadota bacterium]
MAVRSLIFDPFAGISGDMTVAALLDLGLEEAWLRNFIRGLGIDGVDVRIERVSRRGIAAPHIEFVYPPEQDHRHLRHVLEIIDRANAPDRARTLAADAFRRIAAAEARIHGTTIERVHFHEVGATDAILDILSVMAGVIELGFDDFSTRPAAVGSGWIDIAHGRFPVPAPATLGILEGIPVTGTDLAGECTTPTGAAILATLTDGRTAPVQYTPVRVGFGAGSRDPEDRPNVLRLIAARVDAAANAALWIVQADIDDMTAEYAATAQSSLIEAGAMDAVIVPLTMKKGRPGFRIEVLCTALILDAIERQIFLGTASIGLRRWPVQRTILGRELHERVWRGQTIRFKRVVLPDGTSREKPEHDDIVTAARALGLSPWQVRTALDP